MSSTTESKKDVHLQGEIQELMNLYDSIDHIFIHQSWYQLKSSGFAGPCHLVQGEQHLPHASCICHREHDHSATRPGSRFLYGIQATILGYDLIEYYEETQPRPAHIIDVVEDFLYEYVGELLTLDVNDIWKVIRSAKFQFEEPCDEYACCRPFDYHPCDINWQCNYCQNDEHMLTEVFIPNVIERMRQDMEFEYEPMEEQELYDIFMNGEGALFQWNEIVRIRRAQVEYAEERPIRLCMFRSAIGLNGVEEAAAHHDETLGRVDDSLECANDMMARISGYLPKLDQATEKLDYVLDFCKGIITSFSNLSLEHLTSQDFLGAVWAKSANFYKDHRLMIDSIALIFDLYNSETSTVAECVVQFVLMTTISSIGYAASSALAKIINLLFSRIIAGTSTADVEGVAKINLRSKSETLSYFTRFCQALGLASPLSNPDGWLAKLANVIRPIAKISRDLVTIGALFALAQRFFTWISDVVMDMCPAHWVFQDDAVIEFMQIVQFFSKNEQQLRDNIYCREILIQQRPMYQRLSNDMVSSIKRYNNSQASFVCKYIAEFERLERLAKELGEKSTGPCRFDPLVIWLFGEPGLGKSAMVSKLTGELQKIDPLFATDDPVWTPSAGAKHADGYNKQPIVFMDDFNQIKSQMEESDVLNFFAFATCNRTILKMADLEKKGMMFGSKVVIVAANAGWPVAKVQSLKALWRRRHVLIEFVQRSDANNQAIPWNKEPFDFSHMNFVLRDPMNPSQATTALKSWDDIIVEVKKQWLWRKDEQYKNISYMEQVLKTYPDIQDLDGLKAEFEDWFPDTQVRKDQEQMYMNLKHWPREKFEAVKTAITNSRAAGFYEQAKEGFKTQLVEWKALCLSKMETTGDYLRAIPWTRYAAAFGGIVALHQAYKAFKTLFEPKPVNMRSMSVQKQSENNDYLMKIKQINEATSGEYSTCSKEPGTGKLRVRKRATGQMYEMDQVMGEIGLKASIDDFELVLKKHVYSVRSRGQHVVTAHHIFSNMLLINYHAVKTLDGQTVELVNAKGQVHVVVLSSFLTRQLEQSDLCLALVYALPAASRSYFNLLPVASDQVNNLFSAAQTITFRDSIERKHHEQGATLCEKLHVRDASLNITLKSTWFWNTRGEAADGECGSVLYSTNPACNRRILGFLFGSYGGQTSYQMITQSEIRQVATALSNYFEETDPITFQEEPKDIVLKQEVPTWCKGNLEYIGTVPAHLAHAQSRKHDIKHSLCYGEIFEPTKGLSVLSKMDPRIEETVEGEILHEGINKYSYKISPFSTIQHLEALVVVKEETSKLRPVTGPKPRVWTEDEAINGVFQYGGEGRYHTCPGMSMDSSAGFPYKKPADAPTGKRYLFSEADHPTIPGCPLYEVKDETLRREIDEGWEKLMEGEVPYCVWKNCLKSEKRDLAKIKKGSTRVFTAAPAHAVVWFRRLFGEYCAAVKSAAPRDGIAKVGMDATGIDWDYMISTLLGFGVKGFAIDYSAWDARVSGQMFHIFCTAVNSWYCDSKEFRRARYALCSMACHTYTLCFQDVIQKHQGNNSGSPITTELNCVGNLATNVAAASLVRRKNPSHPSPLNFTENFGIVIYGDDMVIVPDESIMTESLPVEWKYALETFGHVVTDAEKIYDEPRAKSVVDLRFLKRTTTVCTIGRNSWWISCLDKESIEQCVNFVTNNPTISDEELLRTNFATAHEMAWAHGYEYFQEVEEKMKNWCNSRGFQCTFPPHVYYAIRYEEKMTGNLGIQ